jgi:L-glyceraldehyde 3-phosphate reductase
VRLLNELAVNRGQDLAQMALSWILKDKRITSVLIGVSKPEQVTDSLRCLDNINFTNDELARINEILK